MHQIIAVDELVDDHAGDLVLAIAHETLDGGAAVAHVICVVEDQDHVGAAFDQNLEAPLGGLRLGLGKLALVCLSSNPGGGLAHLRGPLLEQVLEAVAILLELDLAGLVRGKVAHDRRGQRRRAIVAEGGAHEHLGDERRAIAACECHFLHEPSRDGSWFAAAGGVWIGTAEKTGPPGCADIGLHAPEQAAGGWVGAQHAAGGVGEQNGLGIAVEKLVKAARR